MSDETYHCVTRPSSCHDPLSRQDPLSRHDLCIRRGDSAVVTLRFGTLSQTGVKEVLDLSGSDIVLEIDWPGGQLERRSGNGLTLDGPGGVVTWRATPEETLALPEGRTATYRLMRDLPDGERRTLLAGYVIGEGFVSETGGPAHD